MPHGALRKVLTWSRATRPTATRPTATQTTAPLNPTNHQPRGFDPDGSSREIDVPRPAGLTAPKTKHTAEEATPHPAPIPARSRTAEDSQVTKNNKQ